LRLATPRTSENFDATTGAYVTSTPTCGCPQKRSSRFSERSDNLPDMENDTGRTTRQDAMSVSEAAEFLGVTEDAVRKRIHRGKIAYERDQDGRYIVYPTETDKRHTVPQDSVQYEPSALISELRARVELLEDQLEQATERERQASERDRENRRLLAAALERIPPQLEAPSEPPETPETATEGGGEPRPGGAQEGTQRAWWKRILGG
jgi:excisionase family DNA binding protein